MASRFPAWEAGGEVPSRQTGAGLLKPRSVETAGNVLMAFQEESWGCHKAGPHLRPAAQVECFLPRCCIPPGCLGGEARCFHHAQQSSRGSEEGASATGVWATAKPLTPEALGPFFLERTVGQVCSGAPGSVWRSVLGPGSGTESWKLTGPVRGLGTGSLSSQI